MLTPQKPTQAQSLPKTEVRSGPDSGTVDIVNGTQAVNLEQGAKTGFALEDAKGIELSNEQALTAKNLAFERFLQEVITVQMHPAANEQDHQFAEVTVNGEYQCLRMGEQYDIKRCHAAVLANAKSMRLEQVKIVNPDGSMGYREKAVMRQMYPFAVVHDPNPQGARWIMQLLKNPA